jgi:hypothetical protein
MLPEDLPDRDGPGNSEGGYAQTIGAAAMACAGSTCLGADTDASTAVVARSTVSAALVTAWVATFSTLRVAARTVFAVLLIADRA